MGYRRKLKMFQGRFSRYGNSSECWTSLTWLWHVGVLVVSLYHSVSWFISYNEAQQQSRTPPFTIGLTGTWLPLIKLEFVTLFAFTTDNPCNCHSWSWRHGLNCLCSTLAVWTACKSSHIIKLCVYELSLVTLKILYFPTVYTVLWVAALWNVCVKLLYILNETAGKFRY